VLCVLLNVVYSPLRIARGRRRNIDQKEDCNKMRYSITKQERAAHLVFGGQRALRGRRGGLRAFVRPLVARNRAAYILLVVITNKLEEPSGQGNRARKLGRTSDA
jgi:hypothetical protein